MDYFMGYVYAAIFVVAGLILIFQMSKENKIFYVAGAYFVLMGAWWGIDAYKPEWTVFAGVPGIIFKVITGVVLVILSGMFVKIHLENRKKEKEKEKAREEARARAKAKIEAETAEKEGK